MPTYEYKCDACGFAFEKFQSMTSAPIKKCPHCGKNRVKRLIGTGAGLIFKGSGFYITDYRNEAYKSAAKADSGAAAPAKDSTAAASAGSSTSESKSKSNGEAKPAAEPKTKAASDAKPAASSSTKSAKTEK